jgi:hypothetical protein
MNILNFIFYVPVGNGSILIMLTGCGQTMQWGKKLKFSRAHFQSLRKLNWQVLGWQIKTGSQKEYNNKALITC